MGIILSIIGYFLSNAQKHNRYRFLSIIGRSLCADVKNDDDLDDTITAAELLNLPDVIMVHVCN